jgi:hypothetical protein
MSTFVVLAILIYFTGCFIVWVMGRRTYYTSIVDEFAKPQILGDLTRQEDGRTLVRSGAVCLIGVLPWLAMLLLCVVAYWAGLFDVITPLRFWLFGPSLKPF